MPLEEVTTGHGEANEDRGVDDGLVALRQFMVGQAGAASWAVRRDAVVLHEQTLVEDLLERPPHRLDVVRVHGPVGVAHVDPVAHALGQVGERVDVAQHRLAAAGVELGDAVGLDVLLAGEPELLLDRELDRQAMAVPSGLARDVVALHRPIAGEHVLEDAGLDVVGARHAVGGRWTLVEDPLRPTLRGSQRAGEHVLLAPQREDLMVECGEVHLRGHGAVHSILRRTSYRRHAGACDRGTSQPCRPTRGATLLDPAAPRRAPSPLEVSQAAGSTPRGRGSSGGSGVMFIPRTPPGSHRPRIAHGCVQDYSSPSSPCLDAHMVVRSAPGPRRSISRRSICRVRLGR